MNPFRVGDVVEIELKEKMLPPRLAVITRSIGPVIEAEYIDGGKFFGSYIYAKLPPG